MIMKVGRIIISAVIIKHPGPEPIIATNAQKRRNGNAEKNT